MYMYGPAGAAPPDRTGHALAMQEVPVPVPVPTGTTYYKIILKQGQRLGLRGRHAPAGQLMYMYATRST
eukprot:SAG31_NODE_1537_length_7982_cov_2.277813_13_plen_69_part_00